MCFSKGGILWRFVIKICWIKRSTEVIRTKWQNFLQDPRYRILALKLARRPSIAKRTLTAKQVICAIFFRKSGPLTKLLLQTVGVCLVASIRMCFWKNKCEQKWEKYVQKPDFSMSIYYLTVLQPTNLQMLNSFWRLKRSMYCRTLPTAETWLAPCDFFLFSKLKKKIIIIKILLSGRGYRCRSALGSSVHQFLMGVPKDEYGNCFKNWIKILKRCVLAIGPQSAFYINLHRAVIGPSATLTGRWRPDVDLRRMLRYFEGK